MPRSDKSHSPDPLIPPTPTEEAYGVADDQGEVFTHDNPVTLFREWFALARAHEPNDPNAMALATVDKAGLPDVRIVLLKDIDDQGVSFFTNLDSAKGLALTHNPVAALCFHWKSIRRQVRFRGSIEPVSSQEADAYFASRARGSQIGAWASDQSRPLESREDLVTRTTALEAQYEGKNVPRPPHWGGFRLAPLSVEFWVNRPYRLHDRLCFERTDRNQDWQKGLLFP